MKYYFLTVTDQNLIIMIVLILRNFLRFHIFENHMLQFIL